MALSAAVDARDSLGPPLLPGLRSDGLLGALPLVKRPELGLPAPLGLALPLLPGHEGEVAPLVLHAASWRRGT